MDPHKCNVSWDVYYGMYLAGILDSSRTGGNLLLFLNNEGNNQSVSIVHPEQISPLSLDPPTPPQTPPQMTDSTPINQNINTIPQKAKN